MRRTKKLLLVGNWKMYPRTVKEASVLIATTKRTLHETRNFDVIVCPPALFIGDLPKKNKIARLHYGIQNIHTEIEGPYTGEISATQAKDAGVKFALVGHAERRAMGESDDVVAQKAFSAVMSNISPIICIGESVHDAGGQYLQILSAQLLSAISKVPQQARTRILIAYEPVYAIGASQPPAPHDIHQNLLFIKQTLIKECGASVARKIRLLYGGAVTAETVGEMIATIPELDGFLVGRASADPLKLKELMKAMSV
jgi:triosephosphate isomerase